MLPAEKQLEIIKKGVLEIISEEELLKKIKRRKTFDSKSRIWPYCTGFTSWTHSFTAKTKNLSTTWT